MKLRGIEFAFDILRADDADLWQAAAGRMAEASRTAVRPGMTAGQIIRGSCAVLDAFLSEVFGEDYAERLSIDPDNLRDLWAVYNDALQAIEADTAAAQATADAIRAKGAALPAAGEPAEVLARVDARAQAAAARAAQALPGAAAAEAKQLPFPAAHPAAQPVAPALDTLDFARMNRAQRRACIKSLTGRK